jgi:tRNA A-37 threonylcarbamoyl transferase component Bud32
VDFPRVGAEFAGYRLESVIARGGMSTVFLSESLRLARKVAVKVLALDLADDDTFRERFVRESLIAASLDHPNVIPIYDAGEFEGLLYIAMRYVQGPQLKTVVQTSGPLPPDRLIPIMAQIGGALDAAHVRGLIHRDVKPGNILVDTIGGQEPSDHVYLCDFGLTKQASSHSGLTQTGQFMGTIDYIAPEQIEGRDVDARTDIYSLGCVLYECLTGSVPFKRPTEAAVLWAHIQDQPIPVAERNPELPAEIDSVIDRALDKAPDARYQSCGELVAALRSVFGVPLSSSTPVIPAAMANTPVPAGTALPVPPPMGPSGAGPERTGVGEGGAPAGRSPAPPPRRRAAVIGAVMLLIGALVGGGIAYALNSSESEASTDAASPDQAADATACTDIAGSLVTVGTPPAQLDEGTLMCLMSKHIPREIRATCASGTGDATRASADLPASLGVSALKADVFLECTVPFSGTDFEVWYLLKHDRIDVAYDYQAVLSANGFEGAGKDGTVFYVNAHRTDCAAGSALERRWYVVVESNGETIRHTFQPQPIVLGIPSTGRFACWRDADERPWVAWTDANLPVLALAKASSAGYSRDLLDWWQNSAGPGHPPNA